MWLKSCFLAVAKFFGQPKKQRIDTIEKHEDGYSTVPEEVACSVTQRVRCVKQPYGGYLPRTKFVENSLGQGIEFLHPEENVAPTLIGMSVDYLTRFMSGTPVAQAFQYSLLGAAIIHSELVAKQLLHNIKGLDDTSIISAIRLTGFDVCFRAGISGYKPVERICPDKYTIENVRTMVKRSLNFFDIYGPIIIDGPTFEGGYTHIVSFGDGDFLTKDTLWDFKVSKLAVNTKQTLQLFMYWRMGLHSIHPEFQQVRYLGIYNPRKNIVYRVAINEISEETIKEVDTMVIGYNS